MTARQNAVRAVDDNGNLVGSSDSPINTTPVISTDMEGGGEIAVGTTAVEVSFTGTTKTIIITAKSTNSGTLYIGKSNVASNGSNSVTFLEAGDSVSIDYDDSDNPVYVVASTTSQAFYKGALL